MVITLKYSAWKTTKVIIIYVVNKESFEHPLSVE